ncbi:hypothetical protein [Sphingobium boeckii]|uniref:Uncharacterized protein n=1 Tax=Sphingobium boeckii TaxID=1082345 RepID=A0A7W9AK50_9SPHN|nr:hypothetical protein [Sphingobium boeckii]MBB5686951.1 hypothetical protein [Sphingobium boeckii]
MRSYLRGLPDLPPYIQRHGIPVDKVGDIIAADVQIVAVNRSTVEARVIAMRQGSYAGKNILLKPEVISSCDVFPRVGAVGTVVGSILSSTDQMLVIDPITGPSLPAENRDVEQQKAVRDLGAPLIFPKSEQQRSKR